MNHLRIILPYLLFLFYIQCAVSDPIECEQPVSNCLFCKNTAPTKCETCIEGYTAYAGNCKKCPDNCKACKAASRPTQCSDCFDGYYLQITTGIYGTCNQCPLNCKKCDDSDTCTECEDKYYLDSNNVCQQCHESCLTCTGQSEKDCETCNDGFYVNSETHLCESCAPNCKKCDKLSECITCHDGYSTYDSQQCKKCDDSCKTCQGMTKEDCLECADGYFRVTGQNQCSKCNDICKTCENAADHCTACNDGYYMDGTSCTKCRDNCHSCTSGSICTSCEPGYLLYNDNCDWKCSEGKNCYECIIVDYEICTSCPPGYYMDDNKDCQSCEITGCSKCDKAFECTACMSGYLKEGNICTKCDDICRECEGTKSTCTLCYDGYYKDGTTCQKCPDNCIVCESGNTCLKCADGFYESGGKCEKCDESCSTCTDGTNACTICAVGYYKNDLLRCVKCAQNCDECTSEYHCTNCAPEFFLTESFTCSPCAEVCFECTGPTEDDCIECDPGFYLSRTLKKCFKCHKACTVCDGPNDYNCSQCAPGYYMNKDEYINKYEIVDKCVECEYGCLSCSSSQNCLQCKDGFYLSNGDCFHCDVGCNKCTALQKCTECLDGFYVAEKNGNFVICDSCPPNCKSCTFVNEDFICNSCFDGYFLKEGECAKCNSPCATCSSSETKCDSCIDGYLLDKSTSTCNSKCEPSCQSCESSPSNCVTCHDGFVLNGTICLGCPSGCRTCEFEGGSSSCTGCLEGFYKFDESCIPCDTSCATCYGSYSNECYSCKDGYAISYRDLEPYITATCSKCDAPTIGVPFCELCTSKCSETEEYASCPITCTKCVDGYYLNNNNICLPCHESCGTCGSSATDCLSCAEGYFLYNGNCEKCDASCFGCSEDPNVCTSCHSHKYLINGKCEECDSSCSECQSTSTYCTVCSGNSYSYEGKCYESCSDIGDNFGSNSDRQCQKCELPNCKVFDSSCRCTECKIGFFYMYDPVTLVQICKACNTENCKTCNPDGKTCSECQDGFQTEGSECKPYQIEPDTDNRYVQNDENAEQKHFIIEETTITGNKVTENGGAVLLVNQGLTCISTTFKNCVTSNGGGGSIFIYNKDPVKTNKVSFKNLVIQSCEALFGGGAFIYSISEESVVMIESCKFISNKINKEGKNGLVGGSALYIVVKDGQVNDCFFSNNKGGNIIKVSYNFDIKPEESYMMMLQKDVYSSSVLINKCSFELSENSTGSLLYYVEKQTSRFDVNDFVFADFGGKSIASGNKKLKSIVFSDSKKQELNKQFIGYDSDDQNEVKNNKKSVNKMKSNATLASICFLVAAAVIVAVVILKKGKNDSQISDVKDELTSRSIDHIEE